MFAPVLRASKSHMGNDRPRSPELRKPNLSLWAANSPAYRLPCSGDILWTKLVRRQLYLLLSREAPSLPSKAVYIIGKRLWDKGHQCLSSQDGQKHKRPMDDCLPTAKWSCSYGEVPRARKSKGFNIHCQDQDKAGTEYAWNDAASLSGCSCRLFQLLHWKFRAARGNPVPQLPEEIRKNSKLECGFVFKLVYKGPFLPNSFPQTNLKFSSTIWGINKQLS